MTRIFLNMDVVKLKIKKRDGSIVSVDQIKIENAINKSFSSVGEGSDAESKRIAEKVLEIIGKRFSHEMPSVEEIQDVVEEMLILSGYSHAARSYILYREHRSDIRRIKTMLGVKDDLKLNINAIQVLRKRYLLKDEKGEITETPLQMFSRVAKAVAEADGLYERQEDIPKTEAEFLKVMANMEFLPNSPTLMNAGTPVGQLSACFVIPVEDSISSIFDAVKHMAIVHKSGGGTGFSFSAIRPTGDVVKTTHGIASGPLSFMRVFDVTTDVIKQGGRRRGANMGILRIDHPDIIDFISAKERDGLFNNFNLSVAVTREFMHALEEDGDFFLKNPRTGERLRSIKAGDLFKMIVASAWRTGDPGLVFIDRINEENPIPELGYIEATNPCGEQPLLNWESCNLGSINLAAMVENGAFDFEKFNSVIETSIHFLDNVIDINNYPLERIKLTTLRSRKIGLGVMGLADALIMLGIPYDSEEALAFSDSVAKALSEASVRASEMLAFSRGAFPAYEGSKWQHKGIKMRNATTTTIAPTGTLSLIAGCSSGIEPLFAVSFIRNIVEGTRMIEANPLFKDYAEKHGFDYSNAIAEVAKTGSCRKVESLPESVKRIFVAAHDIDPEWHVRIQAVFQRYTDNAVSKTINLPEGASLEDVEKSFLRAYSLGCKGITVYRYGSKSEQVLYIGGDIKAKLYEKSEYTSVDAEYAGGCPTGICYV